MSDSDEKPLDVHAVVQANRGRLEARFASAAATGAHWLVECRDLGDAFAADAGVFFEICPDDDAVDALVARCTDTNAYERLLGIYDLRRPLRGQGPGLTRKDWLSGKRAV